MSMMIKIANLELKNKDLREALDWSLDDPQMDNFIEAVKSEMQHQRKRWGKDHDHDKGAFDWIALAVRLQGKMVEAVWDKDKDKFLHHVITLAATMGNCHAANISNKADNASVQKRTE